MLAERETATTKTFALFFTLNLHVIYYDGVVFLHDLPAIYITCIYMDL